MVAAQEAKALFRVSDADAINTGRELALKRATREVANVRYGGITNGARNPKRNYRGTAVLGAVRTAGRRRRLEGEDRKNMTKWCG